MSSSLTAALVAALAALFPDLAVSAVGPRVERDGSRAIGVRADPIPAVGSLHRANVNLYVVCPLEDETRFGELVDELTGWRPRRVADGHRTWRLVEWRLIRARQARTADRQPHARDRRARDGRARTRFGVTFANIAT